jgi:Uma2 family endonuclease
MTTRHQSPSSATMPPDDPFPHGWRYVKRVEPDGTEVVDRIALTADEALHPQEGDQVTESTLHDLWRGYLRDVFRARTADDPTIAVLSDVRVEWDRPNLPAYGPDVAVMTGVRRQQNWRTFNIDREGASPALFVEITSPSTADADRAKKRVDYGRAGVTMYIIVDAVGGRGRPQVRLVGHQAGETGYEVIQPNADGRLWLPVVRVFLGLEAGRPRCYDEAGRPIPDYVEQVAQITEQAARIAELEAELRRARGGSAH